MTVESPPASRSSTPEPSSSTRSAAAGRRRARRRIPIGWIIPVAVLVLWFAAYSLEWINPVLFS
ncbi:MAG: hypothetical protein ACTJHU_04405, partial [Mycetocola sp.]